MKLTEPHLKILVILSNEKGYSNKKLTEIVTGDLRNKGNISKFLSPLMYDYKLIENLPKENSKSGFHYFEYNLHIIKDIKIFNSIIENIYNKYYYYTIESAKLGEEYNLLKTHGAYADDRMINFLSKANEITKENEFFSKALNDFTYSQYTGEIVKKYGIKDTLNAIPMMAVDDYIKFVDWADENEFTDTNSYVYLVFSLSQWMFNQFVKKSKKFAELMEESMASKYEEEFYIHDEDAQDLDWIFPYLKTKLRDPSDTSPPTS